MIISSFISKPPQYFSLIVLQASHLSGDRWLFFENTFEKIVCENAATFATFATS